MKAKLPTVEVTAEILADTLHDLRPEISKEDWLKHVNETGHDPKLFFGSNGEGLAEYEAFTKTYDKDNYERQKKLKARRKR